MLLDGCDLIRNIGNELLNIRFLFRQRIQILYICLTGILQLGVLGFLFLHRCFQRLSLLFQARLINIQLQLLLLQLGFDSLNLLTVRFQIILNLLIVIRHLIDIFNTAEELGNTLGSQENLQIIHIPVLIHHLHTGLQLFIMLVLVLFCLLKLSLCLRDQFLIVRDLCLQLGNVVDTLRDLRVQGGNLIAHSGNLRLNLRDLFLRRCLLRLILRRLVLQTLFLTLQIIQLVRKQRSH